MARRRAAAPAQCALTLLCVAAFGLRAAAAFTTPLPPPPPPALPPPPPAELRLLARKCCAAWEHLAFNASAGEHIHAAKCAPREGGVVRHVTRELLAAAAASGGDALHWLPGALRPAALPHDAEAWIVEYSAAGALPCSHADRLVLRSSETDRYHLEPNGTLILYSPTASRDSQPRLFTPDQYCVDSADEYTGIHGTERVFHMCPCDATHTCVRKCCSAGMVMRAGSTLRCVASTSGGTWSPFAPPATNESSDSFPNVTYEILNGRPPNCATGIEVKDPEMYPAHVLDAWLAYPHGWIFQENGPCADLLPGGGVASVAACARPVAFEGYESASGWAHALAAAMLGVALALGEATTALGSAVAAHAISLALRSALLAARLAPGYAGHCTLLSLLIYFFMVSSALWMNVIAINMIISFRRAEPSACGATAWTQQAVAWGGAGLMAGATAAAWLLPTLPAWLPRPLLRATRICYHDALLYSSKWGSLLYFVAPMGVLLIVNIGLITYITIRHRTPDLEKTHLLNKDIYINIPSRRAVRYAQQLALLAAAELAAEAAVVAWAGGGGAREAQRWGEAAADCADVLRAVAVFAFCACSERARAAVGRALDATGYALGRCTVAGCCEGKVSPSESAEHSGAPGDEWRYVIGGAPAPVAGSEERRKGQQRHRRSRPVSERPVIELWAVGGPPAQASPDTPPAIGTLPVFQTSQPTSSL